MNTNVFSILSIHLLSTSLVLFVFIRVHSWLKSLFKKRISATNELQLTPMNTNVFLDLVDPFTFHSPGSIRVYSCSFVAEIFISDYAPRTETPARSRSRKTS